MSVRDYCQRPVATVQPRDTVREAARRMVQDGVGCVVVVDEGRPVGVLTDRDVVLRVLGQQRDAGALEVREIVSGPAVTVRGDQAVGEAVRLIRRHGQRRLPVVDGDGGLVGIVTADDLLTVVAGELAGLGAAVDAQRHGSAP